MSVSFDPSIHLDFHEPNERLSMQDLGLGDLGAPSSIGVTEPFQLCSAEGVIAMRSDVFQPSVIQDHLVFSKMSGPHCQLRGMASTHAKFVHDFWKSPEVLAAVSKAAGCDLVPVFDYELGHVNIQVPAGKDRLEYVNTLRGDPVEQAEEDMPLTPPADSDDEGSESMLDSKQLHASLTLEAPENAPLVVDWHRDAYPWVCVLMLSDVSLMKGGETAILCGDGRIHKAIGPQIGSAVLMQGGWIKHAALPCTGSTERITMVTSFRPKSPRFKDISNLDNIRICSNWYDLYDQWVQSRLSLAKERIQEYSDRLKERREALNKSNDPSGGPRRLLSQPTVDLSEFEEFQLDLADLLTRAREAMRPYSDESRVF